jgi:hypothetical protein
MNARTPDLLTAAFWEDHPITQGWDVLRQSNKEKNRKCVTLVERAMSSPGCPTIEELRRHALLRMSAHEREWRGYGEYQIRRAHRLEPALEWAFWAHASAPMQGSEDGLAYSTRVRIDLEARFGSLLAFAIGRLRSAAVATIEFGPEAQPANRGAFPEEEEAASPEWTPDSEESVWAWIGEERRGKPSVEKLVATYLDAGANLDDRVAALDRLAALAERSPNTRHIRTIKYQDEAPFHDPAKSKAAAFGGYDPGFRKPKKRGKQKDSTTAVHTIKADGEDWGNLANDEPAIRGFLKSGALSKGYSSLDDLLTKQPTAGRPSPEARRARADLAELVRAAREREAKQEAIGNVIGRSKQRVADLELVSGKPGLLLPG